MEKGVEWENGDINYWRGFFYSLYEFNPEIIPRVHSFAEKLIAEHEDARDYAMFHLIIGSSYYRDYPEVCQKLDFDGDDSIRKFLWRLKEESAKN